jgi:hypothetical protein
MRVTLHIQGRIRRYVPKFVFGVNFSEFLLDHIEPAVYFDRWSIQPFNGQARRWQTISAIARKFQGSHAIETGTFLGSSTPYLSSLVSGKTYTIEIDKSSANKSLKRFAQNHAALDIELILGDSAVQITNILKMIDPKNQRIIAYLDAHWLEAIPTADEILALHNWGGVWIAIIDDFKVPAQGGYGFDRYGIVEIGPNIVPKSKGLRVFLPSGTPEHETGSRRGTGYVFSPVAVEIVRPDNFDDLVEYDIQ